MQLVLRLLVFCQGEEGVFEGRTRDFEAAESFVAQEHLADYGFGVGGGYDDGAFVELDARLRWGASSRNSSERHVWQRMVRPPLLRLISAGVPSLMTRPLLMTMMRWARASASSR